MAILMEAESLPYLLHACPLCTAQEHARLRTASGSHDCQAVITEYQVVPQRTARGRLLRARLEQTPPC